MKPRGSLAFLLWQSFQPFYFSVKAACSSSSVVFLAFSSLPLYQPLQGKEARGSKNSRPPRPFPFLPLDELSLYQCIPLERFRSVLYNFHSCPFQALKKAKDDQEVSSAVSAAAPATMSAAAPVAGPDLDRQEKLRLELLKQKSRHDQSAVASPEVKRHLQEFVLQKKRKEAAASAASMGNLKLVPTAVPPSQPILRKTASESNLLKMKSPRLRAGGGAHGAGPYSRGSHPPSIPETSAVGNVVVPNSTSSPAESVKSTNSSPPVELSSPMELAGLRHSTAAAAVAAAAAAAAASSQGSSPSSPQAVLAEAKRRALLSGRAPPLAKGPLQRSLDSADLASSAVNSKSLPNIPSAVSRLAGKEGLFKRKSPPPHISTNANRFVIIGFRRTG